MYVKILSFSLSSLQICTIHKLQVFANARETARPNLAAKNRKDKKKKKKKKKEKKKVYLPAKKKEKKIFFFATCVGLHKKKNKFFPWPREACPLQKKKKKKKPKKKKKEKASIVNIFEVFEIQPLPILQDCVYGQISRRQFVGTKNLIICVKFKINLN